MHGPITALRVLGQGIEVTLAADRPELRIGRDPPPVADVQLPLASISSVHALLTRKEGALEVTDQGSKNGIGYFYGWSPDGYVRCESTRINVGDRFALGSVRLLALDEPTHQITTPLAAYCGPGAHDEVDRALEAVLRSHMIILRAFRGQDVLELAHMLHDHSMRKDYPFTKIDAVPESKAAIDELCTQAGCGTVFLDLTAPFSVPLRFAQNLFSTHFHLWPIIAAPTAEQAFKCLGKACSEPKPAGFGVCPLGFSSQRWHLRMQEVSFTKL